MPVPFLRQLLGCAMLALSSLSTAQTASDLPDGPVDARAVWQERALSACRSDHAPSAPDVCMLRTMRRTGASPQAIAAARMLVRANMAAYISAWRPLGKVALATITYPFRANTNEGTLLIGSDGTAFNVDEYSVSEEDRATPAWRAFTAAHPDAMPYPASEFVGSTATSDGGQSLLFSTPLIPCHACAHDGALLVAYTIDKDGIVRERQLLTIR